MNAGPAGESVDWIDETGRLLGVVDRARMRAGRLRHRAVFVAVVDTSDAIVVHRRAGWKDVWPSAWDLCFGGVVAAGETWDDAAGRELAEEAGLTGVTLEPLGEPFVFDDESVSLLGRAYLVRTDAPIVPRDGEVAELDRVPRAALAHWATGRVVCPDSLGCVLPLLAGP